MLMLNVRFAQGSVRTVHVNADSYRKF